MDCSGIREVSYEYLNGGLGPEEAAAVGRHLDGCPSCTGDLRDTKSTLTLLDTLPEIEADPGTWSQIESKLPAPIRRVASFRNWIRVAAAASILVAVASFAVLMTLPRTGALPVVAETSKALKWNEPFTAEKFTTLILPDVGTLKLNQDSQVRFPDARTCVLETGDVFADILPSGRGFRILSKETTVQVHGTRFGVTSPATVYVVEGSVEVSSPRGRLRLSPRQASVGTALVDITAGEYLQWLARYERPQVRLKLDPRDRTTITPGAPLQWNLVFETDALAPLYLGSRRDLSQHLSLRVNDTPVPLDPNAAVLRQSTVEPNGLIRLDVSHPCTLECAVDPSLFREKGAVRVRAVFVSGTDAPEKAWRGILESNPVHVEVK